MEEAHDWYITSDDDFTEIWFKGEDRKEDSPIEFWFRCGELIVLDIVQSLANQCGSLIVVSHSGSPVVLVIPDAAFPTLLQHQDHSGFVAVLSRRLPIMVQRLAEASPKEILFILSQIRQAVRRIEDLRPHEFFQIVHQGVFEYRRLLSSEDTRIRYLAFDLVTTCREKFYEYAETLRLSIENESDSHTKEWMIYAIEKVIVRGWAGVEIDPGTKSLLDLLREVSDNTSESPPVALAATNLLARARRGLLTPAMRTIFIDALVRPEH